MCLCLFVVVVVVQLCFVFFLGGDCVFIGSGGIICTVVDIQWFQILYFSVVLIPSAILCKMVETLIKN